MITSNKPLKIVYLDRAGLPEHIRVPPIAFDHFWEDYPFTPAEQVIERSQDADILVVNKVVIDNTILIACPNLKHIVVSATGYNIIDLNACRAHDVSVSNVPSYAATTVSEHVIAMALTLRREIRRYSQRVKQGDWSSSDVFCLFDRPFRNLRGATIGLIGLGEIGHATAELAQALGLEVIFCARRRQPHAFAKQVSLSDLLKQSDIISLHCSLNDSTLDLISDAEFELMQDHAIVINTARGGIVNEIAAENAIKTGKIAGLALDVMAQEPPNSASSLIALTDLPNVIITPHIAWASDEAMQFLANTITANIEAFVARNPINLVS